MHWDRVSHLIDAQKEVQAWQGIQFPPAHKQLEVRVLNDLMGRSEDPIVAGVLGTLDMIPQQGNSRDKESAAEARSDMQ